jgi:hypothetical protein
LSIELEHALLLRFNGKYSQNNEQRLIALPILNGSFTISAAALAS